MGWSPQFREIPEIGRCLFARALAQGEGDQEGKTEEARGRIQVRDSPRAPASARMKTNHPDMAAAHTNDRTQG
jgi:hypothetical protein